jgi:hypothetical protein
VLGKPPVWSKNSISLKTPVALARQALADLPDAHIHPSTGKDLDVLGSGILAFAFSVFHHFPGKAAISSCIAEVGKHLHPGDLFKFEVQDVLSFDPPEADTWLGSPLSEADVIQIAQGGDARWCPFVNGGFDAAISMGMMFHLSRGDQPAAFASVSRVLKPGAPFLFTGAEIEGADDAGITGTMNGVTFHYYAVPSYRALISEQGLVLVEVQDDPGVATYYLTRKSS